MTDNEILEVLSLLSLFRWPADDKICAHEAHRILRRARGEVPMTWDDFQLVWP